LQDEAFAEMLRIAGGLLNRPPTTILAIQPGSTEARPGLSYELQAKLPEIVLAVCDSLWQRRRQQLGD
jgi:hypothetical protein